MRVGRNVTIRRAWAPDKTGMSDGYGRQVDMGTGRNGATVEMRMPGKHGRRVGMGAGRNANIGRNAGWYRLVFGQASFLDGLLSPMGSGCWGGCPNHIFGLAIVNWKADRLISCCSGDRRQFEG